MTTLRRAAFLVLLFLCWGAGPSALGAPEELPPWAAEPAARPLPANLGKADAVLLFTETLVEFAPTGRRTERVRSVLRLITTEGRAEAVAAVAYQHPADKVRQLSAWLRDATGSVRVFGRKDVVDVAADREALYDEGRVAQIDASAEAAAGAIFAWESLVELPPDLPQDVWLFQTQLPVVDARYQLRLPKGWSASAVTFNHEPLQATPTADGLSWSISDVPALKAEPLGPPPARLWGRVCLDIQPAPAAPDRPPVLRTFAGWPDVAQHALARFSPSSVSSPALRAKVATLCAGKTTAWEKIRALAAFVQNTRYIAIAANLRRDGGITPRPAETVLGSGYGDCKDKASLLCAMLAEAGVPAYPVLVFSGDRGAVRAEWPSTMQFNHMIAAIRVDESVVSPMIVDTPAGRLLLFDPTDQFTRIGGFPVYNQGGLVLVCTPGAKELTRVPFAPPEENSITFATTAVLTPDGSLSVDYHETDRGAAAGAERDARLERAKVRKTVGDELKEFIPGAATIQAETKDVPGSDSCELTAKFALPRYAHAIRKNLLALRPVIIGRLPFPPLNEKERNLPLRLSPLEREVVAEFTIPADYHVVEPGPATHLETPFGTYDAAVVSDGSKIIFRRKLVVRPGDFPAADYEKLRAFLDAARKRDKTPILIERS